MKALTASLIATLFLFLGACASTTPTNKETYAASIMAHNKGSADAQIARKYAYEFAGEIVSVGEAAKRQYAEEGPEKGGILLGGADYILWGNSKTITDYDYWAGNRTIARICGKLYAAESGAEELIVLSPALDSVFDDFPGIFAVKHIGVGDTFGVSEFFGRNRASSAWGQTGKEPHRVVDISVADMHRLASAVQKDGYVLIRGYAKSKDVPVVAPSFGAHKKMHESWVKEVEDPNSSIITRTIRTLLKPIEVANLPRDYVMDMMFPISDSQRAALLESAEAGEAHRVMAPF